MDRTELRAAAHTTVDEHPWHALAPAQVSELLQTSAERGLDPASAARLLQQYGPNELAEAPRPGFWHQLLQQFNNFVVIILIVASLVSAILGDFVEAAATLMLIEVCRAGDADVDVDADAP